MRGIQDSSAKRIIDSQEAAFWLILEPSETELSLLDHDFIDTENIEPEKTKSSGGPPPFDNNCNSLQEPFVEASDPNSKVNKYKLNSAPFSAFGPARLPPYSGETFSVSEFRSDRPNTTFSKYESSKNNPKNKDPLAPDL